MRISDWSSDVCSSDLVGAAPGPADETPVVAAPADTPSDTPIWAWALAALAAAGAAFWYWRRRTALAGPAENGRAAGGERVCQYVYIQGVGGYLKKNKRMDTMHVS